MCQEYKLEQCEELWRVECGNRTQLEPAISTAHCPRAWGTFADEEDECGVFWKCQDGKANRSGLDILPALSCRNPSFCHGTFCFISLSQTQFLAIQPLSPTHDTKLILI